MGGGKIQNRIFAAQFLKHWDMKRIALFILPLLVLVGCKDDSQMEISNTLLNEFDCINFESYGSITFKQGNERSILISGPRKMVKNLDYKVSNGQLLLTSKSSLHFANTDGVHVIITAPDLSRVVLDGAGAFSFNGLNLDHDLYMRCAGACKIRTTDLQCADFTLNYSGVGEFDGLNLRCENVDVSVSGVGKAHLNVECRNNLSVKLGGVGSITVSGTTKHLNLSSDGVGSVNVTGLTVLAE